MHYMLQYENTINEETRAYWRPAAVCELRMRHSISIYSAAGFAADVGLVDTALDAGAFFDAGADFFDAGAFLVEAALVVVFFAEAALGLDAAALALVVVAAFLAGDLRVALAFLVTAAFLAAVVEVVFFTAGFFADVDFFAAVEAVFFAAGFAAVFVVVFLVVLAVVGFAAVLVLLADLVAAALGFAAGLFSLPASERALGTSLTLPDGPLGRWNMPRSSPVVMARLI